MNITAKARSFSTLPALPRQTFKPYSINKKFFASPAPDNQPITFGDYITSEQQMVGMGSCSKVYKAKHAKTGQMVALKIIDIQKVSSKVQKRFIKNEIYCLKQLRKAKCIIHLKQIIYSKKNIVIVSQLCKESLYKIMKKHSSSKQPLDKSQAFRIFEEIVEGYLNMREFGFVHRDIKPANILLDFHGRAKLADLGFATLDSKLFEDKFIKAGSPLYMAPEIFKSNSYSAKGDIWAMGIVLLEMLIGDLPWINANESQLSKIIVSTNFQQLLPEDLQQKWKNIVLKCLEINPAKRWGVVELMQYINPEFVYEQARQQNKVREVKESFEEIQKNQVEHILTTDQSLKDSEYKSNDKIQTFRQRFQRSKSKDLLTEFKQRKSKPQLLINDKLKTDKFVEIKLNFKDMGKHSKIKQQQTSILNLGRLAFRIVQSIEKGKDNIHCSCLSFKKELSFSIAALILKLFAEIKELKSYCDEAQIQSFRASKQYQFLLQMLQKYQTNYREYFQLKFYQQNYTVEAQPEQIIKGLKGQINIARDHAFLIFTQMKQLGLEVIADDQICKFMQLIECFANFCKYLKLYNNNRYLFVRINRIAEILKKPEGSLTLADIKRISSMIEN